MHYYFPGKHPARWSWLLLILLPLGCSEETDELRGFYQASRGSLSGMEERYQLFLEEGQGARLVIDLNNHQPRFVQRGRWRINERGVVVLQLPESVSLFEDQVHFRPQPGGLRLVRGAAIGLDTLDFYKARRRPLPEKEIILLIGGIGEGCSDGPDTICYRAKYGQPPQGPWRTFPHPIDGFNYRSGFGYHLRISRLPGGQGNRYRYRLLEAIDTVKYLPNH